MNNAWGGEGNAIYVPYGDVPPIRVYFLAFESETGCLFSSLTLKQDAKFVESIRARVLIHSTVWHPHLVITYLSFAQEINPSFDVFNILIVIRWHTVQQFVRVSFENNSFPCFDILFGWLLAFPSSNLPREFAPPPKTIGLKTIENNRKISITKEICITIDSQKKSPEESQTPRQGVYLKISLRNRVTL